MTTTAEHAPTLAERLERAREAEVGPRERLAALEAAYRAAVDAHDHGEAARLERELQPAKEQAGFASALVRALSDQVAALDAERQARQDELTRARQMDEARAEHARCLQAVREHQEASVRTRAQIPAAIKAIQQILADARAADQQAQAAHDSGCDALDRLGEPVHRGSLPSPTKVLVERDECMRLISTWTGADLSAWLIGPPR